LNKRLVISGCSYGLVYSEIQDELKEMFGMDEVINLSGAGASPDRQIRVVIEWIAQNGNPDMVIVPVSHYNRFDIPVAKEMDPLHNLHFKASWQMIDHLQPEKVNPEVDISTLKTFLRSGAVVHNVDHTDHDKLFVKLITFQSFLELRKIKHLIFDSGNHYEKLWMPYLVDQPGMEKMELVKNCPGIYKFFSFCSNAWMYENHVMDKKNYIPWNESEPLPYPLSDNQKATVHHRREQVLQLIKHLKQEGAIYG